ncbi:hypothetical protein ACFX13_014588 [Malus domestica]
MFMLMFMGIPKARLLDNQLPPPQIWAPPAIVVDASSSSRYTHTSIETLVVVLAVITIVGVIAGIVARLCGGRHLGAEHDIEGWVESKCRSCIDGGVPPEPSPAAPQSKPAAATEEAKK